MPKSIGLNVKVTYQNDQEQVNTRPLLNEHSCFLSICQYDEPVWIQASFNYILIKDKDGYHYEIEKSSPQATYATDNNQPQPLALHAAEGYLPSFHYFGGPLSRLQYRAAGFKSRLEGGDLETHHTSLDVGLDTWAIEYSWHQISWQVSLDGQSISDEGLVARMNQIEKTLLAQTDLASAEETLNLAEGLEQFFRASRGLSDFSPLMRDYLNRDIITRNNEGGLLKQSVVVVMRQALVEKVQNDAKNFFEQGQALIQPDFSCDQQKYGDLVNQLENWNVGSAAYLSDVNGDRQIPYGYENEAFPFSADTQLKTIGLRQKLRKALRPIAQRCEPQSAKTKVDFAIND